MQVDDKHISVWGRTLEEYKKMFNLENLLPSNKILSIADGPSTFNLELRERGTQISSVDPIYNLSVNELKQTFEKSYSFNKKLFLENPKNFSFKTVEEMESVLSKRRNTFDSFIIDYQQHKSNYRFGKLPTLEFEANTFDICLCSNFLFMFDHILDIDFHIISVREMLRVSNEVRIFPLYNMDGQKSKIVEVMTQYLSDNNYIWTIEDNDYHIWKNGNNYIRIINATGQTGC